jgi:hypothetical protein
LKRREAAKKELSKNPDHQGYLTKEAKLFTTKEPFKPMNNTRSRNPADWGYEVRQLKGLLEAFYKNKTSDLSDMAKKVTFDLWEQYYRRKSFYKDTVMEWVKTVENLSKKITDHNTQRYIAALYALMKKHKLKDIEAVITFIGKKWTAIRNVEHEEYLAKLAKESAA